MIDDEVLADVTAARAHARACELRPGVLDTMAWQPREGSVELHPAWHSEPLLDYEAREALRITRSALSATALRCRAEGRWAPLVVVANAWGYGRSAHGAWRTRRILSLPDVEDQLAAAVATLDDRGAVAAYYRLNNHGHLHGWGPALFTVFLELADARTPGTVDEPRALALEAATASAVNALVPGSALGAADWGTAEYALYLTLLHRIAAEMTGDPVAVRAALAAAFRG